MKHIFVIILVCALAALSVFGQQQATQSNTATKPGVMIPLSTEQIMTTSGMPGKISYQGALTYVNPRGKVKPVKKGDYSVQFELFDDKTAGTLQDAHTYTVTVDKYGVYTVTLGEDGTDQGNLNTSIFNNLLWLQVTALSGPETKITYPYALARVQLTSVPYALGPWQQGTLGLSYTAGNVGIGIAPTGYNGLHLHNPLSWTAIRFTSNTTGSDPYRGLAFGLNTDVGDAFLWNFSNQPIFIGTNSIERMRITEDGKVGIGTHIPATALDVNGDITVSGNVKYASPKTGYASGTGWASGRGLYSTSSFTYSSGLYNDGVGSSIYEVPLDLPNGVTMTSVAVFGNDVSATYELRVYVQRQLLSAGVNTTIGSASSGVVFSGGAFTATAATGSEVVNNSIYAYSLSLYMPATISIKYYSYRVTFTYNSPGAISQPMVQPVNNAIPSPDGAESPTQEGETVRSSSNGGR
ncbi:MAG: hypothetical protein QME52_06750 [Bacteroidota bacterium]|nr:hypothetical protein [Bacteroidota bacterium]